MKGFLIKFGLLAVLANAAVADGISTLNLNEKTYSNINKVYVSSGNRVIILYPGGGTSTTIDKLPQDFLASWGIGQDKQEAVKAAVAEQDAKNLDRAILAGSFRRVHGIIYDTRKPESGWVVFRNAKVYQIVDDGALVDSTPGASDYLPILVRNLPNVVGDSDYVSFTALPDGTYSYVNKLGEERVIRAYDAGRICDRSDIPPAVLSGAKAFDVAVGTDTRASMARDVVGDLPESYDLMASGSGFFVTEDGYFITNAHVVKNSRRVKIKIAKDVSPATIVRTDAETDLALLKVDGHFKPLPIATNTVDLGQAVFTIGFPDIKLQGTEPKYTDGKISSLSGMKDDPTEYQISVPVQPGNSGGPLVDLAGKVEGVIVARLNDMAALESVGSLPQNVNYAIKGTALRKFLSDSPDLKLPDAAGPAASAVSAAQQAVGIVLVY